MNFGVSPEVIEVRRAQQDLIGALVNNIYCVIKGRDCPRHLSLGMATSAVLSLQTERDALRAQSAAFDAAIVALQQLSDNDLNDSNCASVEVAAKRVRNIARAALNGKGMSLF